MGRRLRYTPEQEQKIIELVNSNQVPDVIKLAEELGKSPTSIRAKLKTLGLPNYSEYENSVIKRYFSNRNKSESVKRILEVLPHRSKASILSQAIKLGVSKPNFWTQEENEIIAKHFNNRKSKQSCTEIHNKFLPDRSIGAIETQAHILGLCREYKTIEWKKEELDILHTFAESVPVAKIMGKLRKLWNTKKWQHRTENAVKCKLTKLQYSLRFEGDYYTINQLADALRCSRSAVAGLYRKYAAVLKPEYIGNYNVVKLDNLRNFIMQYPGEIANLNPDIVWLVGVLSSDTVLSSFSNQSGYR